MRAAHLRRCGGAAAGVAALLVAAFASGQGDLAAQAQAQADAAARGADELVAAWREKTAELERLRAYNDHLQGLVADQRRAQAVVEDERGRVQDIRAGIVPLMTRMVDELEQFVDADLPIRAAGRRERVAALRASLRDAGSTSAETFRRIVEVYQAELELGRKIATYRGELERDGTSQVVNFLHLGRVLLAYQSEDRSVSAFWNTSASPPGWQDLPAEYRNHLDTAMRVADRQAAPVLLRVPVPAPEGAR